MPVEERRKPVNPIRPGGANPGKPEDDINFPLTPVKPDDAGFASGGGGGGGEEEKAPEPEAKTVTYDEFAKAAASKRQGALFATAEEDKTKLAAQFKGKPVRFCRTPPPARFPFVAFPRPTSSPPPPSPTHPPTHTHCLFTQAARDESNDFASLAKSTKAVAAAEARRLAEKATAVAADEEGAPADLLQFKVGTSVPAAPRDFGERGGRGGRGGGRGGFDGDRGRGRGRGGFGGAPREGGGGDAAPTEGGGFRGARGGFRGGRGGASPRGGQDGGFRGGPRGGRGGPPRGGRGGGGGGGGGSGGGGGGTINFADFPALPGKQ